MGWFDDFISAVSPPQLDFNNPASVAQYMGRQQFGTGLQGIGQTIANSGRWWEPSGSQPQAPQFDPLRMLTQIATAQHLGLQNKTLEQAQKDQQAQRQSFYGPYAPETGGVPWKNPDTGQTVTGGLLDQVPPEMRQIIAAGGPEKGTGALLSMLLENAKRSNFRPMSADEMKAFGLPPGVSGVIDTKTNEPKILHNTDVLTPDAYNQKVGIATAGKPDNIGTIPPGYQLRKSGDVTQMMPIPGSPAELEYNKQLEAAKNRTTAQDTAKIQSDLVLQDIGRAINIHKESKWPTTGFFGERLANMPGTAAHDLRNTLETIEGNISFEKLNQMRQASPTGGALGSVSDKEIGLLKAAMGNLRQSSSNDLFEYNLKRLYNTYADIIHGKDKGPDRIQIIDVSPSSIGMMSLEKLKSLNPDDLTAEQRDAAYRRYRMLTGEK